MQRVLFILYVVFCSTLGLCVAFVGFSWMENQWASYITTEEVAVMSVEPIGDSPQEISLLPSYGCAMREVGQYSVEFDCPPGVQEKMMAWHRAFHPDFIHVDEP